MYLLPPGAPTVRNKWNLGALTVPVPGQPPNPLPGPMPFYNGGSDMVRVPLRGRLSCPAWGCGPMPIVKLPVPGQPPNPPAAPQYAPGSNAGTPVPAGFPTNQFYVNSDGSVWEYNNSTGVWFNTGTPYNPQPGSSPTTTTAVNTSGTPVPAGFPTNQTFFASDGSQWTFNAATNSWTYAGIAMTPTGAASSTASGASPSVSVTTPTTESTWQSILTWLSEQTLISGIPNWIPAAAAAGVALYFWPKGKR